MLVANRNIVIDGKNFVIGAEIVGVEEGRQKALIRDGLALYVQPKAEFIEAQVENEVEKLDPEKGKRK